MGRGQSPNLDANLSARPSIPCARDVDRAQGFITHASGFPGRHAGRAPSHRAGALVAACHLCSVRSAVRYLDDLHPNASLRCKI